jgi:hypothetical protein
MSMRTPFGLGALGGFLLLAVALAAPTPRASAQTQPASAPASQLPPAAIPPAMQTPPLSGAPPASQTADVNPAVSIGDGLCQCVAQTNKLDFSCPGSVQACQSACGTQYSFKPDARCRPPGTNP